MVFKPFLNDHAAQRMPYKDRSNAEMLYDLVQVTDVIRQTRQEAICPAFASIVSAQTECMGLVTLLGEIGQEVFVPDPGAATGTMDEDQRYAPVWTGMRGSATDDFQLHSDATDTENGRRSNHP